MEAKFEDDFLLEQFEKVIQESHFSKLHVWELLEIVVQRK